MLEIRGRAEAIDAAALTSVGIRRRLHPSLPEKVNSFGIE
jgi:hypothetical protein